MKCLIEDSLDLIRHCPGVLVTSSASGWSHQSGSTRRTREIMPGSDSSVWIHQRDEMGRWDDEKLQAQDTGALPSLHPSSSPIWTMETEEALGVLDCSLLLLAAAGGNYYAVSASIRGCSSSSCYGKETRTRDIVALTTRPSKPCYWQWPWASTGVAKLVWASTWCSSPPTLRFSLGGA